MNAKRFGFLWLMLQAGLVYGQARPDSFYVFVGERIALKALPREPITEEIIPMIIGKDTTYGKTYAVPFRSGFVATYRVVKPVYGSLARDTVEFTDYTHYGRPLFAPYKHVLLFISRQNGKLISEVNLYTAVYPTTNGRWAGDANTYLYNQLVNVHTAIKPEPIEFTEEVSIGLDGRRAELFPPPYYRIEGNKAIVVMGNYIEDLFSLYKAGILKNRGIFD
ncbi:hypothetical protein F5984_20870 [Rudanella paleaurantiibacter]|uniref:Uncharacterized protein n=1 Tax=Rudanella paleaurantiibacter TaxID=2614655 RepID=A0A7J5TU42_9BACT|nr:hypothetical protein [Rudanella paleaurantiibacter]KAB7727528.1 hypothetical protein F5984_20870 [Rudanella paleaurantiibacter]